MSDVAFVIIDMQNDFVLPTGSLSVQGAEAIVPIINQLRRKFNTVVWSQDWHPPDHISFVTSHPGKKVYEVVKGDGFDQLLFPVHCVAGSSGAAIHSGLQIKETDLIIKKGQNKDHESFSCFFDTGEKSTGGDALLKSKGIKKIYLLGVATDFCVKASVLDALKLGYSVYVIEDGIAAVNSEAGGQAIAEMKQKGATFIKSGDVNV
jgi:nicotinamidase/pyrazinamidase